MGEARDRVRTVHDGVDDKLPDATVVVLFVNNTMPVATSRAPLPHLGIHLRN